MLDIETEYGIFSNFKDLFQFMKEENLKEVKIIKVKYCLSEIFGKGLYTISQIKDILEWI